ncbi:MAG: protein-L-isoaspartate(D-aspartate) O-methyltransferase [Bacteroidales bacterium]|jgi:protein-L-isoaspartate(D-aspartate) O-methyltransferase|nr:protein-L-isoaspartate(D-aspartate) O-methyltransferase [Bacteroidales bacterium]
MIFPTTRDVGALVRDYAEERQQLITLLREKGIKEERVLSAFDKVPRHLFVEDWQKGEAYLDKALPIFGMQTISRPHTVAFQTQLLDVKPTDKILEIGTGSGFQAAILSVLGKAVYSIERTEELYRKTKNMFEKNFNSQKYNFNSRVFLRCGDGFKGWSMYAPYDKIIITCGAPEIPTALLDQLKIGGIMVIPLIEKEDAAPQPEHGRLSGHKANTTLMKKLIKYSENQYQEEDYGNFSFVPMLKDVISICKNK